MIYEQFEKGLTNRIMDYFTVLIQKPNQLWMYHIETLHMDHIVPG